MSYDQNIQTNSQNILRDSNNHLVVCILICQETKAFQISMNKK